MSADGTTTAASTPSATADPQDPLPESNWLWRRLFVGVICAAILFIVWWYADDIGEVAKAGRAEAGQAVNGLVELLKLSLYLLGLVIMLYLIAPSAEQAGKWLATISAWKGGVSTASAAKSTAPDGSIAAASTSAGIAGLAPRAPAVPDAPAEDLPDYAR